MGTIAGLFLAIGGAVYILVNIVMSFGDDARSKLGKK